MSFLYINFQIFKKWLRVLTSHDNRLKPKENQPTIYTSVNFLTNQHHAIQTNPTATTGINQT